jgi:hypothetical protein
VSIGDPFWLFFIFSSLQPMLRQQYLQMRACKISQIEDERKPRMILLVHPQETMRFLGFPIARYSTSTIPKNHARHPDDRRGRADRSRAAHAGRSRAGCAAPRLCASTRPRSPSSSHITPCRAAR